jgi:uncharacterized protein YegJ (DUF2314 family)
MARPIPVFAFAFAAFAATSTKEKVNSESVGHDGDEFFLKTWRASKRANAELRVKVGVLDEGAAFRLCDRISGQSPEAQWIWLAQIAETARGFSGAVAADSERPKRWLQGQRIGFEVRQILGWTLGVNASAQAIVAPKPPKPIPRFLSDLDFS